MIYSIKVIFVFDLIYDMYVCVYIYDVCRSREQSLKQMISNRRESD